jgi:hypothetical protein
MTLPPRRVNPSRAHSAIVAECEGAADKAFDRTHQFFDVSRALFPQIELHRFRNISL